MHARTAFFGSVASIGITAGTDSGMSIGTIVIVPLWIASERQESLARKIGYTGLVFSGYLSED